MNSLWSLRYAADKSKSKEDILTLISKMHELAIDRAAQPGEAEAAAAMRDKYLNKHQISFDNFLQWRRQNQPQSTAYEGAEPTDAPAISQGQRGLPGQKALSGQRTLPGQNVLTV